MWYVMKINWGICQIRRNINQETCIQLFNEQSAYADIKQGLS